MTETALLEIGRDATWMMLLVAGPLLAVGLVVGLAVALFQALTSIQEASLAFVPKMVAMLLALLVLLPFMITTLSEFTQRMFERIAQGG